MLRFEPDRVEAWYHLGAALNGTRRYPEAVEAWEKVIHLAQQKPLSGWGWISYWAPWVEPFKGLAIRNRVASLIDTWNLANLVDQDQVRSPIASMRDVKVIPFSQKDEWVLTPRYKMGKKPSRSWNRGS